VIPPRNRKGETGNPPPTVRASEFYPNRAVTPTRNDVNDAAENTKRGQKAAIGRN
jgi:hypothetical protein